MFENEKKLNCVTRCYLTSQSEKSRKIDLLYLLNLTHKKVLHLIIFQRQNDKKLRIILFTMVDYFSRYSHRPRKCVKRNSKKYKTKILTQLLLSYIFFFLEKFTNGNLPILLRYQEIRNPSGEIFLSYIDFSSFLKGQYSSLKMQLIILSISKYRTKKKKLEHTVNSIRFESPFYLRVEVSRAFTGPSLCVYSGSLSTTHCVQYGVTTQYRLPWQHTQSVSHTVSHVMVRSQIPSTL